MPTVLNAVETLEFSVRCGDNLLNKNLTFDLPFSANVVSGTGTANTSTDVVYSGQRSLYVNNLSTTVPLVISGGGTNWNNDFTGSYILGEKAIFQFSLFNSNGVGVEITGRFRIFTDSFKVYTIEFSSIGIAGWQTFYQNIPFYQNYDFTFELDNDPDEENAVELYLDGIKLEIDDKGLNIPTPYTGYVEKEIFVSQTIDVPSIGSNASETVTATVTGAEVGDFVQMTYPIGLITSELVVSQPLVTASNEVKFIIHNHTGGSINPDSGNYTFKILK